MQTLRIHCPRAWCLAFLSALASLTAQAHPMGNFSVAHATSLQLDGRFLRVRFRLDLAEVPAAGEMRLIDSDSDGKVSDAETKAYLDREVPKLTAGQTLRINRKPVTMEIISSTLQQRPGAADATTLLVTIDYLVTVERGSQLVVEYADGNWPGRSGWREITARAWVGWRIAESDVGEESRSGMLEEYPTDVNAVVPAQIGARVVFEPVGGGTTVASAKRQTTAMPTHEPQGRAWFWGASIVGAVAVVALVMLVRSWARRLRGSRP